jgi:hypothetical protein
MTDVSAPNPTRRSEGASPAPSAGTRFSCGGFAGSSFGTFGFAGSGGFSCGAGGQGQGGKRAEERRAPDGHRHRAEDDTTERSQAEHGPLLSPEIRDLYLLIINLIGNESSAAISSCPQK